MRTLRILCIVSLLLSLVVGANAQGKGEKTVVYNAVLHCASCKAKVEKNIPYEKGVKDLKVDMAANTITVTFKEGKNTAEDIQKAIEKLDIKVTGTACPNAAKCGEEGTDCSKSCDKAKAEAACEGKCGDKCCSKTGNKADCCKNKK